MLKKIKETLNESGVNLNSDHEEAISLYISELLKWNKSINLTAITTVDEIYEKHIIDCLNVIPHLKEISSIIDVGSGAGLPGILIALVCPQIKVLSVESVGKKANFQKNIKRKLNLKNLEIYSGRVENIQSEKKTRYDMAICRAFSSLENFINLAEPLVSKKLIAMKGPEGQKELEDIKSKKDVHNIKEYMSINYSLPKSNSTRNIIILSK